MFDRSKTDQKRPPPLPSSSGDPGKGSATKLGSLARTRAFLQTRRVKLAESARRLWQQVRRRPALAGAAVAAVVVAGAVVAAISFDVVPDRLNPFAPTTVKSARADARSHPNDAVAQRTLGHALWSAKKRPAALAAYGRALAIDPTVADGDTVTHLVACFGTREQGTAEGLITKHKLVQAESGLQPLTRSRSHGVRWGAVHTLDKLGKGSKAYWENAYVLDLDSPSCDTRRRAVDKLGAIGSRRAVAALRSAKADDAKTGGFFKSRCLGDRLDDAEQKILARR